MGHARRQQIIRTKQYDMQIIELADDLLFARFDVRREQPTAQFNVFGKAQRLVIVKQLPQPIWLRSEDMYLALTQDMAIYLPPFSIVDWVLPKGESCLHTFGAAAPLASPSPEFPFVFNFKYQKPPQTAKEFECVVDGANPEFQIGRNLRPNSLARKTKNWLSKNFNSPCRITELAHELDVTRESLSRNFKDCYGIIAQDYRKQLRVDASLTKLIFENETVTDAAFSSGFDSLGNFYRQFKHTYDATPKKFNPTLNANEKQEVSL